MQLPNNAISAEDAAKMIGIAPKRLRELMREGKIKGVKIKKYWYCDLDSINDYINRNGSKKSDTVVIDGEKYIAFSIFCQMRGIMCGRRITERYSTIKLSGRIYISESEARRYDKRFEEFFGRKIVTPEKAAEMLNCSKNALEKLISGGKIEKVIVDRHSFVFTDSIERYQELLQAGEDFLQIPQNGRIRRAEVILDEITNFNGDNYGKR